MRLNEGGNPRTKAGPAHGAPARGCLAAKELIWLGVAVCVSEECGRDGGGYMGLQHPRCGKMLICAGSTHTCNSVTQRST